MLAHGWPYSFASMLPLAEALRGELDVIVPSLPGYAFSDVLPERFTGSAVARRWHAMMTDELGYDRYLTYGEDVGAEVSDWLAATRPEAVAGIVDRHQLPALRGVAGGERDPSADRCAREHPHPAA